MSVWAVTGARLMDEDEKDVIREEYCRAAGWPASIEESSINLFDCAASKPGSLCARLGAAIRAKQE